MSTDIFGLFSAADGVAAAPSALHHRLSASPASKEEEDGKDKKKRKSSKRSSASKPVPRHAEARHASPPETTEMDRPPIRCGRFCCLWGSGAAPAARCILRVS